MLLTLHSEVGKFYPTNFGLDILSVLSSLCIASTSGSFSKQIDYIHTCANISRRRQIRSRGSIRRMQPEEEGRDAIMSSNDPTPSHAARRLSTSHGGGSHGHGAASSQIAVAAAGGAALLLVVLVVACCCCCCCRRKRDATQQHQRPPPHGGMRFYADSSGFKGETPRRPRAPLPGLAWPWISVAPCVRVFTLP
jgi:hypothetical protein